MARIEYSDFDPAWITRRLRDRTTFLDEPGFDWTADAGGLSNGAQSAYHCASFAYAAAQGEQAPARLELSLSARVVAHLCLVTALDEVRYQIDGRPSHSLRRAAKLGTLTSSGCVESMWLAMAMRDRNAREIFCSVPTDAVRGLSGVSEPDYAYARQDAVRAFLRGRLEAPELLARALELTDPSQLDDDLVDYTLMIVVPAMEVLFQIIDDDAAGYDDALAEALVQHRRYYTEVQPRTTEIAKRPRGEALLPITLLGLAAIAYDRGLRSSVESDYLPPSIVRGEHRANSTRVLLDPIALRDGVA